MARTAGQLVAAVKEQGDWDDADSVVLSALNERYAEMVSEAKWLRRTVTLGPTDGTSTLVLPTDALEVHRVRVGGSTWAAASPDEVRSLQAGYGALSGAAGAFALDADSAGLSTLILHPAPSAGLEAVALASISPTELTLADTPNLPAGFEGDLIDGTIAVMLRRRELNMNEAAAFEERFQTGIGRLARRARRRLMPGPTQMRVYWP